MRKATMCGFALALLFLTTGCSDSPEKVTKDGISLMNDMSDILEKIDSKESAEKQKSKLESLTKKAKELEERSKKLKMNELSDEKKKELQSKFKDDGEKAAKRFFAAMTKVMSNKETAEALKDIDLKGAK